MVGLLDAAVACDSTRCATRVPWRVGLGLTEIAVFGIELDGVATLVGDKSAFTYR